MKKTDGLWIILKLIFLIIFNVLFFVLSGFKHNAIVWTSYGFILFAYLMLLLTPRLIRKGKSAAVFGFSLYSISAVYFIFEFIIGLSFILVTSPRIALAALLEQFSPILRMFVAFADAYITALRVFLAFADSYAAVLSIQLILAGVYVVIFIVNMIANEHTADAEEKRQYQIDYVKNASLKLKFLMDSISDKEAKKKVERVYDAVYSSPVKTHPNIAQKENDILQSINELENAVSTGNNDTIITLANSLLSAVNERNMRLKTLN